jgi:hypothetical protein
MQSGSNPICEQWHIAHQGNGPSAPHVIEQGFSSLLTVSASYRRVNEHDAASR